MAEYLTTRRPDGETVIVSRKLYERNYRALGYEEVDSAGEVTVDTPQGEVVSTNVDPGDDPKLTPDVVANGPDDPDEDKKPKRRRKTGGK